MAHHHQQTTPMTPLQQAEHDEKKHKHMEEAAALEGLGAAAFAHHEKHEGKKDPENEKRHKREEELADLGAVAGGGGAFFERHENKGDKKDAKADGGEKHHHHLHL